MIVEDQPIDWGMGELLAYGTLLWEGTPIRLAGQDSRRGTFSHRHAVWMDQEKEQSYIPLQHLKEGQGSFTPINSPLSEMASLGFEYGYSVAMPEALTLWEAQFGDFCNGAQVIIDQYIATAENKWAQQSDLVLLLPHGYEGQGPEHSSARMERFLQLAANDNMIITYPSTPAQLFHLLRRQKKKPMQKPLIIFTPKALLRHPRCVSRTEDFSKGHFMTIIESEVPANRAKVVVFCTGKIYYDAMQEKEKRQCEEILFIRIEQLYPLNIEEIKEILNRYPKLEKAVWAQEEPANMGAASWIAIKKDAFCSLPFTIIARPESASPATGYHALHEQQSEELLQKMFSFTEGEQPIERTYRV